METFGQAYQPPLAAAALVPSPATAAEASARVLAGGKSGSQDTDRVVLLALAERAGRGNAVQTRHRAIADDWGETT